MSPEQLRRARMSGSGLRNPAGRDARNAGEPAELAVRFLDQESFLLALDVLDELATEAPLEYNLVGGFATVLPRWSYRRLVERLEQYKDRVHYTPVEVVPMSDLPPERQAQLRGQR